MKALLVAATTLTLAAAVVVLHPADAESWHCSTPPEEVLHVYERINYARSIHADWIEHPERYKEYALNSIEWDQGWVSDYNRTLAVLGSFASMCSGFSS